jgi:phosphoribosyl isomerase A
MTLIPVIDLLRGQVVRGVRGDRQAYRPIESALCRSSDPVTVARILCDHCDARQLYIADLDALMGGSAQVAVLRDVLRALPHLELWLDAGFADAAAAAQVLRAIDAGTGANTDPTPRADRPRPGSTVPIFASESLASAAALRGCFEGAAGARAVLSLDRRDGQRLDAAGCWEAVEAWPERVIVMTLERVGSGAGPDLETLQALKRRSPITAFVGAGGVRHEADLAVAAQSGAAAWLVASALHDGQLPRVHR